MMMKNCLSLAVVLSAMAYASAAVAAPIPAALWDFESESGAGIAANSTASLAVDGTAGLDTGLEADDISGFGGTDPFTIVATFQVDTSSANLNNAIFAYTPSGGTTAGADIRLYVQTDGQIRAEASSGAGSEVTLGAINAFDGNVHNIALVAAGGENFNDLDVYLDGTLFSNPFSAGNNAPINLPGTGDTIEIGQDRLGIIGTPRTFKGLIDDVAIYGGALTEQELREVFADGVIPEPSSVVLLACGVLAVCCKR